MLLCCCESPCAGEPESMTAVTHNGDAPERSVALVTRRARRSEQNRRKSTPNRNETRKGWLRRHTRRKRLADARNLGAFQQGGIDAERCRGNSCRGKLQLGIAACPRADGVAHRAVERERRRNGAGKPDR